jgi:FlgD Ig-like domain
MRIPSLPPRGLALALAVPLALSILSNAPGAAWATWSTGGNLLAGPIDEGSLHLVVPDDRGGIWGLWGGYGFGEVVQGGRMLIDGSRPSGWPLAGRTLLAPPQGTSVTGGAPDGNGGIYVATSYPFTYLPGGRPLSITRVDESGVPVAGWTASGTMVANSTHRKVDLVMSPDGSHGAYLAWLDALQSTFLDSYAGVHEVRVIRLAAEGGLAPGWPDSGLRVSVAPPTAVVSSDLQLEIVQDATDGLYVAWVDSTDGVGDIHIQHLDGDGSVASGWPEGGQTVALPSVQRQLYAIAPDGAGGLLVGWIERGVGSARAYVARFDPDGTLASGWPAEGVRLCPSCLYAGTEAIASDGSGGVYAFVAEAPTTIGEVDLYAHHVHSSGSLDPSFPATGVVVANAPGSEFARGAAPDGAGGAFVLWELDQYGAAAARRMFAIRLSPSGSPAPGWSAGGNALDDGTAYPSYVPAGLFADHPGGAMAWWVTSRYFSQADSLYAYRLGGDADPNTSVAPDTPIAALAVAPNPSVSAATVSFTLPADAAVSVDVFDVRGRHVRTLASVRMAAGPHSLAWTDDADDGRVVAPGVYWVRLRGPGLNETKRIVKLN